MTKKIPDDAFAIYVAMQEERSYQALAERFSVSKRGIQKLADRERWSERLSAIERDLQERIDKQLGESLEEIRLRHLKIARAIAGRAAKALSEYPLTSGMDAVRAAEVAIKLERMISGEPTERTAVSFERKAQEEADRFLAPKVSGPDTDPSEDDEDW